MSHVSVPGASGFFGGVLKLRLLRESDCLSFHRKTLLAFDRSGLTLNQIPNLWIDGLSGYKLPYGMSSTDYSGTACCLTYASTVDASGPIYRNRSAHSN